MSEKRFKGYAEKTGQHHILTIIDLVGEEYNITDDFFKSKDVIFEIVDLLNAMNESLLKLSKNVHKFSEESVQLKERLKNYEYQIEKGYTGLTYEEMLEKESESDE